MTDEDGHRIEAAMQFGFSQAEDDGPYSCIDAQLIAFAKACERKGLAMAHGLANRDAVYRHILALDGELAPILAAEEDRYMTAQGYVRGTDEPGKRWVKPDREACDHQSTFSFGCTPGITKCDKCGKLFGVLNINAEILA